MKCTKKILNFHEETTHTILNRVASQNGAKVFAKVRVADILEINDSGLSNTEYSYAFKSHFDFVVTAADTEPLLAVEFDGPHHQKDIKVAANDKRKDAICRQFQFPILRVNAEFLNKEIRQYSILNWLIGLWFMEKAFERAQEAGQIPLDEPFLYNLVLANPGESKITMPYDLSLPSRLLMRDAHEKKLIKDFCPSVHITEDVDTFVNAIALLKINDVKVVIGKARCRSYQFSPVSTWALCEELAIIDAGEKLRAYINKKSSPCRMEQAQYQINCLEQMAERNNSVVHHTGVRWSIDESQTI